MQERYLGDSHDYAKYALLRHLSNTLSCRIGLNWYLTNHAEVDKVGNNDGEKRHHFNLRRWKGWETDLLASLAPLQLVSERRLHRVAELNLLPADTIYFDAPVAREGRFTWHEKAREALKAADLIFLDPDNGFEVPSASNRTRSKYATYSEALDYVADGKIVIAIQFARQCDPVERALAVRQRLSSLAQRKFECPVVRARLAPNLLFLAMAPQGREGELTACLQSFATEREKIELIS